MKHHIPQTSVICKIPLLFPDTLNHGDAQLCEKYFIWNCLTLTVIFVILHYGSHHVRHEEHLASDRTGSLK